MATTSKNTGGLVILQSMFSFVKNFVAEELIEFQEDFADFEADGRHDDDALFAPIRDANEKRVGVPIEINRLRSFGDISAISFDKDTTPAQFQLPSETPSEIINRFRLLDDISVMDSSCKDTTPAQLQLPSEAPSEINRLTNRFRSLVDMSPMDSSDMDATPAQFNFPSETPSEYKSEGPRMRKKQEREQVQKEERPRVRKAGQRFRSLRGLPGKPPKKTEDGQDLWISSLAGLSLGNTAKADNKSRWKTIRPFQWKSSD
jgi:hypothetical protein